MKNKVTIGICQNLLAYDIEYNIEKALNMVDDATGQGAEIVAFTEMFFTPYEPRSIQLAAKHSEYTLECMRAKALKNKIYIIAGSMPWPSDEKRLYNRAYVIGPDGDIIMYHDKIHLFDCTPPGGPSVKESATIVPGSSLKHFETPWGNASVIVCYDIRFTPLAQLLSKMDLRLLFVPGAFSQATGKAHWEMLIRLRAVELQAFVIGVQPAYNPDLKYIPWGHSMISSPWGDVILDADVSETLSVTTLDLTEIDKIRSQFPLKAHLRDDLYEILWRGRL